MTNKTAWACLLLTISLPVLAQTNNQTSSPYSLFGVGRFNETNSGVTNALGKSGMALSGENAINNLNPAAFADISKNSFLFDIGMKGDQTEHVTSDDTGKNTTTNFSGISFATPVTSKSAIGVSLSPYSDVGYTLRGITTTIEGSQDSYTSFITGSGGLNNAAVNYGYRLTPKLNVGVVGSYYFGKITETEQIAIGTDYLGVASTSHYSGFRFGSGIQYKVNDKLTLAAVVTLPTYLKGTKDRTVSKTVDGVDSAEQQESSKISGFKVPLEAGAGIKYSYKSFTLNADYKHTFWNATDMQDNIGQFVDTNFFGAGLMYASIKVRPSYFERFQYRLGVNMDNGYLQVDGNRVQNMAVTSGVGVPLGGRRSFLNISYSYGQRGIVSSRLVQENYHAFTVNISLEDIWFLKRRYE